VCLGAEWLELEYKMCRVFLFLEDKMCAEKKYTSWPPQRGLIASLVAQVVRMLPDRHCDSQTYLP